MGRIGLCHPTLIMKGNPQSFFLYVWINFRKIGVLNIPKSGWTQPNYGTSGNPLQISINHRIQWGRSWNIKEEPSRNPGFKLLVFTGFNRMKSIGFNHILQLNILQRILDGWAHRLKNNRYKYELFRVIDIHRYPIVIRMVTSVAKITRISRNGVISIKCVDNFGLKDE